MFWKGLEDITVDKEVKLAADAEANLQVPVFLTAGFNNIILNQTGTVMIFTFLKWSVQTDCPFERDIQVNSCATFIRYIPQN